MAYKSVDEFLSMYKRNPAQAKKLLDKALTQGKEPISPKNPGYTSNSALTRRARKRYKRPKTPTGSPGPKYPI